jgi:MFS family permease
MALLPESKSSSDNGFLKAAWLVVALLWPVALLNYLDRQMLASMKFSVMSDIPSIGSNENWGYMLGQFKWVYAFLSPLGGLIADRIGRKVTICGSLFAWSLVTWWTSRATSYDELLMTRSLMGISEAFYIPAALALIADYHLGTTRSRAVGLHQIAIYCGVIMGGFGGYVADAPQLGWRFAFFACGIVGMLYTFPLLWCLRDAPAITPSPGNEVSSPALDLFSSVTDVSRLRRNVFISLAIDLFSLLTNISFILLILYFTLPALAGWVVRDWMPAILKEQFNIGQGKAGVAATLYWQLAAIVGALVGGWLADRWMQKNIRGRIYISAIGMALIVPAIFGVGNASSLMMAISFLILFGLGWGFFDGNNMPILSQIVAPRLRATGYGFMNMVSISCGGLADWGFGKLRDQGVALNLIFGVFAGAAVISVILVLLIRPNPAILQQEQQARN